MYASLGRTSGNGGTVLPCPSIDGIRGFNETPWFAWGPCLRCFAHGLTSVHDPSSSVACFSLVPSMAPPPNASNDPVSSHKLPSHECKWLQLPHRIPGLVPEAPSERGNVPPSHSEMRIGYPFSPSFSDGSVALCPPFFPFSPTSSPASPRKGGH